MTTRSGLIIYTRRQGSSCISSLPTSLSTCQRLEHLQSSVEKCHQMKSKSGRRFPDVNNLSVVTRYMLFMAAQQCEYDVNNANTLIMDCDTSPSVSCDSTTLG